MGFIDIEACGGIVTRMREIADDLGSAQTQLRSQADHVDVDASALHSMWSDIAQVRTMAAQLRTRVDLAIAIEAARGGSFGTGVVEVPNSSGDDLQRDLAEAMAAAARGLDADDEEALAWLAGVLDQHSGDPAFAAQFLEDLGPDELLDLMNRTAAANGGTALEDQQTVMTSLREMLGKADATWTPAERREFGEGLVEAATWQDADVADRQGSHTYGAALAYLLADRPYSTELSVALATGLEEYEHSILHGIRGPEAVWLHRLHAGNPFLQYYPDVPEVGDVPPRTYDASAALMSSLAKNPEAALAVFSRGADGTAVTPTLQHWLVDRTWTEDQFSELSGALAAATVDPGLMADPANDVQRAIVTAATVNLLGARDDLDRALITNTAGPTEAADNFARILSANVLAMDYAVHADRSARVAAGYDDAADAWFSYGGAGVLARFDAQSPTGDASTLSPLARFAVLASATDDSTLMLRTAVDRYAEFKYGVAATQLEQRLAAGGPSDADAPLADDPMAKFRTAWESQVQLEGFLAHAVGRTDIDDAAANDARTEMWAGVIGDAVGVVPYADKLLGDFPQGVARKVIELGISKVEEGTIGRISTESKGETVTASAKAAESALLRSEYQLLAALATSGLVPPDHAAPFLDAHGNPLSYEECAANPSSAFTNLYGSISSLVSRQDLEGAYTSMFDLYYAQAES